jgi:ELP3 family radical SAM enzyme/protein acetyltransferase
MNNKSSAMVDVEDLIKGKNKDQLDAILCDTEKSEKVNSIILDTWAHYNKLKEYNSFVLRNDIDKYLNKSIHKHRICVPKTVLVYFYNQLVLNNQLEYDSQFKSMFQKKPARNLSGVNAFAILLPPYPNGQPFSCKHDCHYCPNETQLNGAENDMPRSYISDEPAVARGLRNGWDASAQLIDRLNSLVVQGHTLGKLDLILEGGTYTEYPMDFLIEFHRDIFYTANTYYDKLPKRDKKSLQDEIGINMLADIQIIGICIETRPDAITDEWIRFFRKTGTTRIQLGVQHTNNTILKRVNRGHTFEQSCQAVDRLKNNCFKIDIHLMPDLPFTTPDDDIKMFETVFQTDLIQPDQVKIYPCQIVPYTKIKKWYDTGKYTPYFETNFNTFIDVIQYAMAITPPWVRLPRVVRDIPASFIEGGNTMTNLRQYITDKMKKENMYSMDIRNREIGRNTEYQCEKPVLKVRKYRSGTGTEYFISFESKDERVIYGFARLRIPDKKVNDDTVFPCLQNRGLIRELHVYNTLVATGNKSGNNASQHKGLGMKLIKKAEMIAWYNGMRGTAVITGEGVRSYYHKKLGYHDDDTFVVKNFNISFNLIKFIILYYLVITIAVYTRLII